MALRRCYGGRKIDGTLKFSEGKDWRRDLSTGNGHGLPLNKGRSAGSVTTEGSTGQKMPRNPVKFASFDPILGNQDQEVGNALKKKVEECKQELNSLEEQKKKCQKQVREAKQTYTTIKKEVEGLKKKSTIHFENDRELQAAEQRISEVVATSMERARKVMERDSELERLRGESAAIKKKIKNVTHLMNISTLRLIEVFKEAEWRIRMPNVPKDVKKP
ncbi:uncharacterized protein G2W53_032841 [Senna tora]|uniref:Uncharacterized protein n=1 Tax=Senna tora TaxID=362788 RepID=A0A834W6N0_9FABA|nr:uncharacterized protein G2W53_032841 [Senna tora]